MTEEHLDKGQVDKTNVLTGVFLLPQTTKFNIKKENRN